MTHGRASSSLACGTIFFDKPVTLIVTGFFYAVTSWKRLAGAVQIGQFSGALFSMIKPQNWQT